MPLTPSTTPHARPSSSAAAHRRLRHARGAPRALAAALLLCAAAHAGAPFNAFDDGTLITTQIPGVSFSNYDNKAPRIAVEEGNHLLRSSTAGTVDAGPLTLAFDPPVNEVQITAIVPKDVPLSVRGYRWDAGKSAWVLLREVTGSRSIAGTGPLVLRLCSIFTGAIEKVEIELAGDLPEVLDKLSFTSHPLAWSGTADFDALAEGVLVTGQYPGLLVLDAARARAQSHTGSAPHTAPHMLAKVATGESDTAPLRLQFQPAQGVVCLRTGYPQTAHDGHPITARLRAFAADGATLLAEDSVWLDSAGAINKPLEVCRMTQQDIAFIELLYLGADGVSPRSLGGEEVLDTVQYGPAMPDLEPDTSPPLVSILTPADGAIVRTITAAQTHATLALTAEIHELRGLHEVVLRLTRTDVTGVEQVHTLLPSLVDFGLHTINPVHSLPIGEWQVRVEAADAAGNPGSAQISFSVRPLEPTVVTSITALENDDPYVLPIRAISASPEGVEPAQEIRRARAFLITGRHFHPDLSVWLLPQNGPANEIYGPAGVSLHVYDRTPTSCKVSLTDHILENWGAEYEWVVKDPWTRPGSQPVLRPALMHQRGETRQNWMTWHGRWLQQRAIVAQGSGAFHLANPGSIDERIVLPAPVTPGPGTRLIFQSRIGRATEHQTARVQITANLDEHPPENTWTTIWSRPGPGTPGDPAFSQVSLPLAEYAGTPVKVRFIMVRPVFGLPREEATTVNPPAGWFIDDILIAEEPTLTTFSSLTYAGVHGFGFANQRSPDMGANAFLATYGESLLLPVISLPNPSRMLWLPVYYGIVQNMTGHCNGLAQVGALLNEDNLFLDDGLPPHVIRSPGIYQRDARPVIENAASYASSGPLGMLRRPRNFWAHVEVHQGGQLCSEFLENVLYQIRNGGPNHTLSLIRSNPSAYQLTVLDLANISNAHVVTPYRVRDVDDTFTEIDVYDSNHPFVYRPDDAERLSKNLSVNGRIRVNRQTDTFEFERRGWHPDFVPEISSGDGLHALPNTLLRGTRTPPGILDVIGQGMIILFGSADATVSDAAGTHSAGWDEQGAFSQNFPGLDILPVGGTDAGGKDIPQAFFCHEMTAATLKADVNVRGPRWITGSLMHGCSLYLEVDNALPGVRDKLTLTTAGGKARSLAYTPKQSGALLMPRAGIEFSASEALAAEWLGLEQRAEQGLAFEALPDEKTVAVANLGAHTQRCVLKITHGSAEAPGDVLYYGPFFIQPGLRSGLHLASWPAAGDAELRRDTDSDGVWDEAQPAPALTLPTHGHGANDSNANGIPDAVDILTGILTDANGDGIPDEVFRPAYVRVLATGPASLKIEIHGQPGANWHLFSAADPAGEWTHEGSGPLDANGQAETFLPVNGSRRFFRAVVDDKK